MAILRDLDQEHNKHKKPRETKIVNGAAVTFSDIVVYKFRMGDVEDPVLYAAQPIYEWQQTEAGRFVMEHAVESPWWVRTVDAATYGFEFAIMARMKEADQTFYILKWGTK